ncbi:MAG: hypothetical protein ACI9XJ_000914, partial [Marivirga sp.]
DALFKKNTIDIQITGEKQTTSDAEFDFN